ncbi:hypothetical protein ACP6PL_00025 [Dapis sp. BLCC M126]|uniref:hypothetical protein n=1 Tax=Dapis sp. BLCC M126 TaxID=3400189 RepID=UPI003CF2658B
MNPLIPQSDPPLSPRLILPTIYDLPSKDPEELGSPDEYHLYQSQLLRSTFKPVDIDPDEIFIGTDINLDYDVRHHLSEVISQFWILNSEFLNLPLDNPYS